MPWQIDFDGHTWREGTLTLSEVEKFEERTGGTWATLNPYHSATVCIAIIEVLLVTRGGLTPEEAQARARGLRLDDALDALSVVAKDDPDQWEDGLPLPEAEAGTDGSSGAPAASAGRQKSRGAKRSETSSS